MSRRLAIVNHYEPLSRRRLRFAQVSDSTLALHAGAPKSRRGQAGLRTTFASLWRVWSSSGVSTIKTISSEILSCWFVLLVCRLLFGHHPRPWASLVPGGCWTVGGRLRIPVWLRLLFWTTLWARRLLWLHSGICCRVCAGVLLVCLDIQRTPLPSTGPSATLLDRCLKLYTTLWNIWTYQQLCKKIHNLCTILHKLCTILHKLCIFFYTTVDRFICFTVLCKIFKQWSNSADRIECFLEVDAAAVYVPVLFRVFLSYLCKGEYLIYCSHGIALPNLNPALDSDRISSFFWELFFAELLSLLSLHGTIN